jgi:hypothetical protein
VSKVIKTPSIDDIRALMASAAQVYWVCPVTQKRISVSDTAAITAHQEKVIQDMEAKEKAKAETKRRQKAMSDLNADLIRIESMTEFRAWAFRRVRLDLGVFLKADMPAMGVYFPKLDEVHMTPQEGYIRLAGGKGLTPELKTALNAKQGKSFNRYHIGKGAETAWFMTIPLSSGLGKKITAWTSRKSKKLTMADKEALAVSNPEYAEDIDALKALGEQIHALRAQASALAKKCDVTRYNALTVLPKDLT